MKNSSALAPKNIQIQDEIISEIEALNFKSIKTFERSRENAVLVGRYKYHDHYLQIFKSNDITSEDIEQTADLLFETQNNDRNEDIVLVLGNKLACIKMDSFHTPISCKLEMFHESQCLLQIQGLISDYFTNEEDLDVSCSKFREVLERGKSTEFIIFLEKTFEAQKSLFTIKNNGKAIQFTLFKEVLSSSSDVAFLDVTSDGLDLEKTTGQRMSYKIATEICDELYFSQSLERPDLIFIKSGQKALLVSPHRPRDRKVLFTIERLKSEGWIKNVIAMFRKEHLPMDGESINIDKVLHTRELDNNFHELLHDYRKTLIEDLLNKENYLSEVTKIINILDKKNYDSKSLIRKLQHDPAV